MLLFYNDFIVKSIIILRQLSLIMSIIRRQLHMPIINYQSLTRHANHLVLIHLTLISSVTSHLVLIPSVTSRLVLIPSVTSHSLPSQTHQNRCGLIRRIFASNAQNDLLFLFNKVHWAQK